ncbi:MAG: M28 family metallopeptidase [Armatimonadia bacterium]
MKLRDHFHIVIIGLCVAGFGVARGGLSPTSAMCRGGSGITAGRLKLGPSEDHSAFEAGRALAAVRYLCEEVGPRPSGGEAERRTAGWIAGRLRGWGYEVTVQKGVRLGRSGLTTCNVIGRLVRVPAAPRVVNRAHMDCCRGAGYRGANDNASGVGVLLELARVQARKKLPCTLEVVFFGGEEQFRRYGCKFGSRHYVASGLARGTRPVVGMISVDMVGRGERLCAWRRGKQETYLEALVSRSATRLGLSVRTRRGRANSDHEAFARAGVPSLWLQRLPDPSYHTTKDLPGNLSLRSLSETGKLLCHVLEGLEAEDVRLLMRERVAHGTVAHHRALESPPTRLVNSCHAAPALSRHLVLACSGRGSAGAARGRVRRLRREG